MPAKPLLRQLGTLSKMSQFEKFKRNYLSFLFAYFLKLLLRVILWTCSYKMKGLDAFHAVSKNRKCILMLWHNRLLIVPEILRKFAAKNNYTAFISNSLDAEPFAIMINSYRFGRTIRVPHLSRHFALKKMIDLLKNSNEVIVITPDGPRGPRYEVKPGTALAAKKTLANIIPFSWHASRFWELHTWDKLRIPKPFSTIFLEFGHPLEADNFSGLGDKEESQLIRQALLKLA